MMLEIVLGELQNYFQFCFIIIYSKLLRNWSTNPLRKEILEAVLIFVVSTVYDFQSWYFSLVT